MKEKRVVINRIRTPDGTILESKNRHDYLEYEDKNGFTYMVDGGNDYLRRNEVKEAPYEELSLYEDSDIKEIREAFEWGTYGKDGDQPLSYVKLKDMSSEHLHAIIESQVQLEGTVELNIFKAELLFRDNL